MQEEIPIKTWLYSDNKKLTLFLRKNNAIAKVLNANGRAECIIPSYDMNIPHDILKDPILLFFYVQETHVRLAKRHDGSFGLYINPSLKGGGLFDAMVSGFVIVGGVTLIVSTGGVGAVIGSGLMSGGINGFIQAAKTKEEFSHEFFKQAGVGLLSGVILGGAGQLAAGITAGSKAVQVVENVANIGSAAGRISTNTAVLITKCGTTALGGAASQGLNSKIMTGEVDTGKVLFGAVSGGVASLAGMGVAASNLTVASSKETLEAAVSIVSITALNQTVDHMHHAWKRNEGNELRRVESEARSTKDENRILRDANKKQLIKIATLEQSVSEKNEKAQKLEEREDKLRAQLDDKIRKLTPPRLNPVEPDVDFAESEIPNAIVSSSDVADQDAPELKF